MSRARILNGWREGGGDMSKGSARVSSRRRKKVNVNDKRRFI